MSEKPTQEEFYKELSMIQGQFSSNLKTLENAFKALAISAEQLMLLTNPGITFEKVQEVFPGAKAIDNSTDKPTTNDTTEREEDLGNFVFPLGKKHRGVTLQGIYDKDPQYLQWYAEKGTDNEIRDKVRAFADKNGLEYKKG